MANDPINVGTCGNWVNPALLPPCYAPPPDMSAEMALLYTQAASEYLWARTGRRLGPSCLQIVRPCRKSCADGYGILGRFLNQGQYQSTAGLVPYMAGGRMYNASLCGCTADCHCGEELCQIELPGPIYDVQEVNIDGVTIDPLTYRVTDGRFLVRNTNSDEERCWPSCQDMSKPGNGPDTFTVGYRTGLELPHMATLAASALASHLMRGCGDGCGCGVGSRENVSRISRQGVELEFADASQVFTDGRTGIEVVDFFIDAYGSPVGLRGQLRVLSPDYRRPRWEQP